MKTLLIYSYCNDNMHTLLGNIIVQPLALDMTCDCINEAHKDWSAYGYVLDVVWLVSS